MSSDLHRARRNNAAKLYGHFCVYCFTPLAKNEMTLDHLLPKDLGGSSHQINVVISCDRCNSQKANKHPKECNFSARTIAKVADVQKQLLPSFNKSNDERQKRGISKQQAFLFLEQDYA